MLAHVGFFLWDGMQGCDITESIPVVQNLQVAHRQVAISNVLGLHLRAAYKFVKSAQAFESAIRVCSNGIIADGRSILDLLSLAADCGTILGVEAQGCDAEDAVTALANLISAPVSRSLRIQIGDATCQRQGNEQRRSAFQGGTRESGSSADLDGIGVVMNLAVDVISDVICPWCYIGKRRLEKAIAKGSGDSGRWLLVSSIRCQWKVSAARTIAAECLAGGSSRLSLSSRWWRAGRPTASLSPSTGANGRRTPWTPTGLSGLPTNRVVKIPSWSLCFEPTSPRAGISSTARSSSMW